MSPLYHSASIPASFYTVNTEDQHCRRIYRPLSTFFSPFQSRRKRPGPTAIRPSPRTFDSEVTLNNQLLALGGDT